MRKHLIPAAASRFLVAACLLAMVSACSGGSPAAGPAPTGTVTTAPVTTVPASPAPASSAPVSSDPAASAAAAASFTVTGVNPVLPNGSQDTNDQAPGTVCDKTKLSADKTLGAEIAAGFALDGFPVASGLLTHFLAGNGTKVAFPAGSAIARQARASSAFRALDREVQQAILGQLGPGRT